MDVVVKSKLAGLILAFSIIFFGLESSYSILLFLVVMLSIGIPHGSVDHLIAFINPNARKFESKFIFYITYLSLIIFNIILWVISPFLGLLVFLIFSITAGSLMVAFTMMVAASETTIVDKLKASTRQIEMAGGVVMIIVGIYLVYYYLSTNVL